MNVAFIANRHRLKQDKIETGDAGWHVSAMLMLRDELRRHALGSAVPTAVSPVPRGR